jgi:hypothetical protein
MTTMLSMGPWLQISASCIEPTVRMPKRKQGFLGIHCFHVLASPLGQKLHNSSKTDLKKYHTLSEDHTFWNSNFGEMENQFFKIGLEKVA